MYFSSCKFSMIGMKSLYLSVELSLCICPKNIFSDFWDFNLWVVIIIFSCFYYQIEVTYNNHLIIYIFGCNYHLEKRRTVNIDPYIQITVILLTPTLASSIKKNPFVFGVLSCTLISKLLLVSMPTPLEFEVYEVKYASELHSCCISFSVVFIVLIFLNSFFL